MKVVFFGSFQHYSVKILEAIHQDPQFELLAVVTTPPQPAGRKQELKQTEVHQYALKHNIPTFTPERLNLDTLQELSSLLTSHFSLQNPDLFIVAGYGKLLPLEWLEFPKVAPLNVHFSLLPDYRGAMPGEWAILMGETVTGVTLIEMAPKFDTGKMVAQQQTTIDNTETRETLYTKLYDLGAKITTNAIPKYLALHNSEAVETNELNYTLFNPPEPQGISIKPYARLIKKDETFIPWEIITQALAGQRLTPTDTTTPLLDTIRTSLVQSNPDSPLISNIALLIETAIRALKPWPGTWTIIPTDKGEKRMKLHSAKVENEKLVLLNVQIEGEKTKQFNLGNVLF